MKKQNFLLNRSTQKWPRTTSQSSSDPRRKYQETEVCYPCRLEPKRKEFGEFLNTEFVQTSPLNRSVQQKQQNAALAFPVTCLIFLEIFSPQYRHI